MKVSYYNSANLCLFFRLSVFPYVCLSVCQSVCLSFDLHENRSHGELQTRPMSCPEPDDVQYGQIIELNEFGVVFAVLSVNVLLRLWRPRMTDCAIVSPRSQLHACLNVTIPGEARSLMVSTSG